MYRLVQRHLHVNMITLDTEGAEVVEDKKDLTG